MEIPSSFRTSRVVSSPFRLPPQAFFPSLRRCSRLNDTLSYRRGQIFSSLSPGPYASSQIKPSQSPLCAFSEEPIFLLLLFKAILTKAFLPTQDHEFKTPLFSFAPISPFTYHPRPTSIPPPLSTLSPTFDLLHNQNTPHTHIITMTVTFSTLQPPSASTPFPTSPFSPDSGCWRNCSHVSP